MQDENLFVPKSNPEPEVQIEISQTDSDVYRSIIPDFEFTPPPPPPPAQGNDLQSE